MSYLKATTAALLAAGLLAGLASGAGAHPRSWDHQHNSYGGYSSGSNYDYNYGNNYGGHTRTRQARVVYVDPVYEYRRGHRRPKQVCHIEQVPIYGRTGGTYYSQGADPGGAIVGALVGGFIGNQITNQDEAGTVIGAIGGALVGSQVGQGGYVQHRQGIVGYESREVCKTVKRRGKKKRVLKGYNVTYRFHGTLYETFTTYHPGEYITIQVRR